MHRAVCGVVVAWKQQSLMLSFLVQRSRIAAMIGLPCPASINLILCQGRAASWAGVAFFGSFRADLRPTAGDCKQLHYKKKTVFY